MRNRQTDGQIEKVIYRGGCIVFAVLKLLTCRSQISVDQIQQDYDLPVKHKESC